MEKELTQEADRAHLFSKGADCLVLVQQLLLPFYELQLFLCQL